jgi:hypothetical protein
VVCLGGGDALLSMRWLGAAILAAILRLAAGDGLLAQRTDGPCIPVGAGGSAADGVAEPRTPAETPRVGIDGGSAADGVAEPRTPAETPRVGIDGEPERAPSGLAHALVNRVVGGLGVDAMRERHLGLVGAIGLLTFAGTTLHPR